MLGRLSPMKVCCLLREINLEQIPSICNKVFSKVIQSVFLDLEIHIKCSEQGCKPGSYASSKLSPSHRLTSAQCAVWTVVSNIALYKHWGIFIPRVGYNEVTLGYIMPDTGVYFWENHGHRV